jgi:hypothetical protein
MASSMGARHRADPLAPTSDGDSYTFEALSETLANLAIGHERFVACLNEFA